MGKEYLDKSGLGYFWGKIKGYFALKNHTHSCSNINELRCSSITPVKVDGLEYTFKHAGIISNVLLVCSYTIVDPVITGGIINVNFIIYTSLITDIGDNTFIRTKYILGNDNTEANTLDFLFAVSRSDSDEIKIDLITIKYDNTFPITDIREINGWENEITLKEFIIEPLGLWKEYNW